MDDVQTGGARYFGAEPKCRSEGADPKVVGNAALRCIGDITYNTKYHHTAVVCRYRV